MDEATSSPECSSQTQVQAESIPPEESQNGNPEKKKRRASLARHSRKCSVCHHPDREFIDDDYLRWSSPETIARQYKISHHSVVYRHALATGLRTQRRASLRATLEHFIEEAQNVRVTAHSLVSAVRLYAQINDQGQWNPPTRRHIVEHHYFTESQVAQEVASVANAAAESADANTASAPVSNSGNGDAPTKTKTTATPIATIYLQTNSISNRELLGLDHVPTH
jgi:hypothetical protein